MAQVRDIFVSLGFDVDEKALSDLDRSLLKIKNSVKGITILFAGASLAIGGFLKAAGDFEQVEIAFETMLGSAEKAKELLDGLKEDARKTPFTLPGILDASKRLLAMGIEAGRVRDTIKILGDVAAGVGIDKLPNLVLALGQVKAATKLRGSELRQFTEAGVPLLAELAESLGKTPAEIQKLISQGAISFEDVRKALENLTTGSGRFANLMERQSQSFLGILSNIKDFLIINAIAIGKELLPQAKAMAKEFLAILEVNREIIKGRLVKFFKSLAVTMGIIFKVSKAIVEGILNITDAMGGLEVVIRSVAIAMLSFTGIQTISAIGSITKVIFGLVKSMAALKSGILLTQATAVAMPILIGAAVIALGLIIEDIIGFFRGKDSVTGLIIEAFEKKLPEAFLNTQAGLFAIKETIGIITEEAKILLGFLNKFLIVDPLKAAKDILSLDAFEGPAKFIFGDESSPATSPSRGGGQGAQVVNLNAPVNVSIPPGTPSALVGESITEGIERVFGGMVRQASRATEPVTEY
jgi:tape measure domain-containing protein